MCVYGIAYGAQIANLLSVAYDICGPDQMVILFSFELAFEGVGGLIGSPLCSKLSHTLFSIQNHS